MKFNKLTLRLGSLILAGLCAFGASPTVSYAESSAELEEKTNELQGELSVLNAKLDGLLAEMDELTAQSEDLTAEMAETAADLDEIQTRGKKQYEDMKLRIKYMYEEGNSSFLELLFSAESMTDFLNTAEFIVSVSGYDRRKMQQLEDTQDEIIAKAEELNQEKELLAETQASLTAKREEVEDMIASTSADLSDYQARLERAKEAEALEAKRRAEEEAARQAAAAAAAAEAERKKQQTTSTPSNNIVSPTPSSGGGRYLGNFKITHYCTCYVCCGSWADGITATGTTATEGRTIAVDPNVIPLGSKVIINGNVYIAEDTGGAIKGNRIDMFINSHSRALDLGVYNTDVYLQ